MKRSYQQNCGLAHGLDVIGDRWTLLVVRELLLGPRRYGELLENLVGIGTNLLAARLKEMTSNGLIAKSASRYELTDAGRRLEPLIWEIVRFGLSLGIEDEPTRLTRTDWDAVALRALYDEQRDPGLDGRYVIELNGAPFSVEKRGRSVVVSPGRIDGANAEVRLSKRTARNLAEGSLTITDGIEDHQIQVDGSRREARQLLTAFSLAP